MPPPMMNAGSGTIVVLNLIIPAYNASVITSPPGKYICLIAVLCNNDLAIASTYVPLLPLCSFRPEAVSRPPDKAYLW